MMNSKTLRRLASDHGALHNQPLPPNYLFPLNAGNNDSLTELDILLAGPTHTPFAAGVWKLHLNIPPTYPQQPPTAHFRTPIFHPNVDVQTGGVCVETLKRDWDARLTLRDVLVTISCLLIQPNPDSALNAEAGALIQEDYSAFTRRAELMTSIHAVVPKDLREAVRAAQMRGHEEEEKETGFENDLVSESVSVEPAAPLRRRRVTARQRGIVTSRQSEGSPSAAPTRRRAPLDSNNPFVIRTECQDPFSSFTDSHLHQDSHVGPNEEDSSMVDADQENDESRSPTKAHTPGKVATPRRPLGPPVPLGELQLDDAMSVTMSDSDEDEEELEPEYPPSPRKSPSKSPAKRPLRFLNDDNEGAAGPQAESSRIAAARDPIITPPFNTVTQPLAEDSPFVFSASPRKTRRGNNNIFATPKVPLFDTPRISPGYGGIAKHKKGKASVSLHPASDSKDRKSELDAKLWALCRGDIKRWNRGQFDGDVLKVKARRW